MFYRTQAGQIECTLNVNPTLPAGCTVVEDSVAEAELGLPNPLQRAKILQAAVVGKAYLEATIAPVAFTTAAGVAKMFQADTRSVANLHGTLAGCGGVVPAGFYWVAADNTQVAFTFADCQGLAGAIFGQGAAAFQKYQGLKAAIQACGDIPAVQAVMW